MCNALGIEPVITTTETSSAEEFADLVEYCHGDSTTPLGKKRIADGHPEKSVTRIMCIFGRRTTVLAHLCHTEPASQLLLKRKRWLLMYFLGSAFRL